MNTGQGRDLVHLPHLYIKEARRVAKSSEVDKQLYELQQGLLIIERADRAKRPVLVYRRELSRLQQQPHCRTRAPGAVLPAAGSTYS